MRHTAFIAAAAATLLSGCASGGPAPGEAPADNPYRYDVPTPPTATYRLADTMTTIMTMPQGEMDVANSSATTIELTFTADSGGVRATGTVSDHSSTMASSMMGNMEMGGDGVSGNLEFVIGPLGEVEMISTPEVPGDGVMPAMPISFDPRALLPRFPGRPLEPGDTWADTVTISADVGGLDLPVPITGTSETTTIYTYALVGDTLVDGRTLQKITVSGVITERPSIQQGGEPVGSDMINTVEGYVLWDAERGLVAVADLVRTVDGSVDMMGSSMSMTGGGVLKLRLVN